MAGTSLASIVYDDEIALIFMTIGPINPGHLLVIPKQHSSNLGDLDEETGAHLFCIAMRTAGALRRSVLRCEGVNFFLADGEAAFQDAFHVHPHVFPRFSGDAFRVDAGWSVNPSLEELNRVVERIRVVLAGS